MKNVLSSALTLLTLLACGQVIAQDAEPISTRYGSLTSGSEGQLMFKGRAVQPQVMYDGSAFYSPVDQFKVGASDVILFQQAQGNSCPGNYAYVTVTAQGAKATKNFGTCYDESTDPTQSGQTISFSMPNLGGKGKSTFIYKDGVVLMNGKPAK